MSKFNVLMTMEESGKEAASIKEQIVDAMTFEAGDEGVGWFDIMCHFVTFFWKVAFALLPTKAYRGGYPLFFASLLTIGFLTMFVGDIAKIFGCTVGVSDLLTAITFVALGTSLPDTFASMTAASQDENADAAIGNVTGSNSVNVFLGLGIPWVIGAHYHASQQEKSNPRDLDVWCEKDYVNSVPEGTTGV